MGWQDVAIPQNPLDGGYFLQYRRGEIVCQRRFIGDESTRLYPRRGSVDWMITQCGLQVIHEVAAEARVTFLGLHNDADRSWSVPTCKVAGNTREQLDWTR